MATYAVGDIHGCFETFQRLLAHIDFHPERDRLWLVGDLVNGGPDSLSVVRWVREHDDVVRLVLGNHDLHMLCVAAGVASMREADDFDDVLDAPDADELFDWLRRQPLVYRDEDTLMVHAGLLPEWSAEDAVSLAGEVEATLASDQFLEFLGVMYGNHPRTWSSSLEGADRLRAVVNACTRMRALDSDGGIDFEFTDKLAKLPEALTPWFEFPGRKSSGTRIVFGHWSAIGYHRSGDVHALDSGCVWGGPLSALRLEDEELFEVESEMPSVFD